MLFLLWLSTLPTYFVGETLSVVIPPSFGKDWPEVLVKKIGMMLP